MSVQRFFKAWQSVWLSFIDYVCTLSTLLFKEFYWKQCTWRLEYEFIFKCFWPICQVPRSQLPVICQKAQMCMKPVVMVYRLLLHLCKRLSTISENNNTDSLGKNDALIRVPHWYCFCSPTKWTRDGQMKGWTNCQYVYVLTTIFFAYPKERS